MAASKHSERNNYCLFRISIHSITIHFIHMKCALLGLLVATTTIDDWFPSNVNLLHLLRNSSHSSVLCTRIENSSNQSIIIMVVVVVAAILHAPATNTQNFSEIELIRQLCASDSQSYYIVYERNSGVATWFACAFNCPLQLVQFAIWTASRKSRSLFCFLILHIKLLAGNHFINISFSIRGTTQNVNVNCMRILWSVRTNVYVHRRPHDDTADATNIYFIEKRKKKNPTNRLHIGYTWGFRCQLYSI